MPTRENIGDSVPLAEAVAEFRTASGGPTSSAETYRKHASTDGSVFLGASMVVTKDHRGRWVVSRTDLDRGIVAEQERFAQITQDSVDYQNHILRDSENLKVDTDWGYYEVRGVFHVHYDRTAAYRRRSDGWWICNTCWTPTRDEHDRPECHTCSDWGDCRRNCTLSAVVCDKCGTRMEV